MLGLSDHVDLLVGFFGVGQLLSRILVEVRLQERFRFRKSEMKVSQRFDPKP